MGLDSYFSKTRELDDNIPDELYFRGNIVYRDIHELIGHTIYTDWITPKELQVIALKLARIILMDRKLFRHVVPKDNRKFVARTCYKMLLYSSQGYGLVGSY